MRGKAPVSCVAERLCRVRCAPVVRVVACAWSSHAQLCCGRQNFLSWPTLSRPKNPLLRQKFSLFWPTLSRHRLALSRQTFPIATENLTLRKTLSRHKNTLSRHRNPRQDQTCHKKEKPCRDIFYFLKLKTMS